MISITDITEADVLATLARHCGADNGVHIGALVTEITGGITRPGLERQVRSIIEQLRRREGSHICATPGAGYFLARTEAELNATCSFLFDRAMTSLSQVAAMKRVSLPDLRGQLHLPT